MTAAGCPRCGGPLSAAVGLDEDDGDQAAVTAVDECAACGYERPVAPMGPAEVRAWVRWRKSLMQQRKEAAA